MNRLKWFKASYSAGNGACVELAFRRSTQCEAHSCVEVATNEPTAVHVRDSKDPDGPVLTFSPGAWRDFLASL